jgi:hypothetical protein
MGQLMNYVMLGGLVIGGIYVFQNPGIIDSTLKQLEDAIGGIGGGGGDSEDIDAEEPAEEDKPESKCKEGELEDSKGKCVKCATSLDDKDKCVKAATTYAYAYLSTPVLRRVIGPGTFYERPRINRRY